MGELLTHIALGPRFQEQINLVEKRTTMEGFDFMALMATLKDEQAKPRTKAEIIALLKDNGEKFANGRRSAVRRLPGAEHLHAAGRPADQPHTFRHADEREGT